MSPTTNEHLLGTIEDAIVGGQYTEGTVSAGDWLHFERQPDNARDPHAIQAQNPEFQPVGYLPRRLAHWLAPLLDEGKVSIDGRALEKPMQRHGEHPVALDLYLCPKGGDILKEDPRPATPIAALHQLVLSAYRQAQQYDDPNVILGLAEQLQRLAARDLHPESHLLLSLFPWVARNATAKRREGVLTGAAEAIAGLRIGEAVHYHNITLFPLFMPGNLGRSYMLLEKALNTGAAEVTEVSEHGSVPELRVRNIGQDTVLITEGEILKGAKQNRVVNVTVLVAGCSEFTLPVSCVEQGRWSSVSRNFNPASFAPPTLRAKKNASVRECRVRGGGRRSNQGEVWEDVASYLRESGTDSSTDSLTDAFEKSHDRVASYQEHLRIPEGAAGMLVCSGERILGVDLFECADTFNEVWPRLSSAYYFEASQNARAKRQASGKKVQEFLNSLSQNIQVVEQPLGLGLELDLSTDSLVGSAIWHDNRICHMSAFIR